MIRRVYLLAVIMALVLPVGARCANPLEVVKQAQTANKRVSYRGMKEASLFFAGKFTTATLKVVHKKPDKTRTDFITPDSIAGVIIIQNGSSLWRYSPDSELWEKKQLADPDATEGLHPDLIKNFNIKLIGRERVAGRATYVIQAVPHNPSETARRLWVDESSYLVIRTQVEDPRGAVVNSSRFTSIEINPKDITDNAFRVTGRVHSAPKPGPREFGAILPKYLPSGYRLFASTSITVNGTSCAHMQFSNGSNIISLFERKAADNSDKTPVPHKSNVATVLTWSHGGIVFTLIGNVSNRELIKIADSMR